MPSLNRLRSPWVFLPGLQVVQGVAAGLSWRRRSVDFIEGGFPKGHPFGIRFTAVREPVHLGRVEEFRSQAGKAAMGADGAGEGGEGL